MGVTGKAALSSQYHCLERVLSDAVAGKQTALREHTEQQLRRRRAQCGYLLHPAAPGARMASAGGSWLRGEQRVRRVLALTGRGRWHDDPVLFEQSAARGSPPDLHERAAAGWQLGR